MGVLCYAEWHALTRCRRRYHFLHPGWIRIAFVFAWTRMAVHSTRLHCHDAFVRGKSFRAFFLWTVFRTCLGGAGGFGLCGSILPACAMSNTAQKRLRPQFSWAFWGCRFGRAGRLPRTGPAKTAEAKRFRLRGALVFVCSPLEDGMRPLISAKS